MSLLYFPESGDPWDELNGVMEETPQDRLTHLITLGTLLLLR